ncbi:MAG: hypothetical protein AVDCRST_MAG28-1487, partial [uncultured Rubrobacteraceae bacterium]
KILTYFGPFPVFRVLWITIIKLRHQAEYAFGDAFLERHFCHPLLFVRGEDHTSLQGVDLAVAELANLR